MRIGPERTIAGPGTCQLRTPAWALSKVLGPHCGWSGPHMGLQIPFYGSGPYTWGFWTNPGGPDHISRGPALTHGGLDSLSMPWSTSPSLATWQPQSRPRGGVGCCCWPRVVTRGWGEPRPGPTHSFFTTRLKIVAWVLRLHTVVRVTLVLGYQHISFINCIPSVLDKHLRSGE
jgi:hypothetical protein